MEFTLRLRCFIHYYLIHYKRFLLFFFNNIFLKIIYKFSRLNLKNEELISWSKTIQSLGDLKNLEMILKTSDSYLELNLLIKQKKNA